MATVARIDQQLAKLEAQIAEAKRLRAERNRKKRRVLKDHEKRRMFVVGDIILGLTGDKKIRDLLKRELGKPGAIRDDPTDREIFADLLEGSYISTAEEAAARREIEAETGPTQEPANQDGTEAVTVAAE